LENKATLDCDQLIQAFQNNGKDWVDYLAALLTPTIAILGVYFARQQWKTNRRRLKNELFDRRYEYFIAVRNLAGHNRADIQRPFP